MPHIDRLAKAKPPDPDRIRVLLREALDSHAESLDIAAILAYVRRLFVGRRLRLWNGRVPRYPNEIVTNLVAVEVELDVWVGVHVPDLDARLCVDEERLAVPQEPNRHGLRMAIAAGYHEPDHALFLQPALRMLARRNHVDKYPSQGCVIPPQPAGSRVGDLTGRRRATAARPG